ncbi:MAG: HNH endonuclease [Clostridiales bacterium]|nr:HNH endonuclease [Clostridiales bacterium]
MVAIDEYTQEKDCIYKQEHYSVRDNGAVLRHNPKGQNPRPLDNQWTFGKLNEKTGYLGIASVPIHRIVATAFHGEAPTKQHVVDHIDTNKHNNRPENLRWLTRLENILLNPITAKRIAMVCGSVVAFLENPSRYRDEFKDPNYSWMGRVSQEEAKVCLEHLLSWAESDKKPSGGTLGDWIFERNSNRNIEKKENLSATADKEIVASKQELQKVRTRQDIRSNPFGFARPGESDMDSSIVMYKKRDELFDKIKKRLDFDKKLRFPEIKVPTAGKGITIKESWIEEIQDSEIHYEMTKRSPKSIILHCAGKSFALIVQVQTNIDTNEIGRLKKEGLNIVVIDFSWAKKGVTVEEIKYILEDDITKKRWIYHEMIQREEKRLQDISEPISDAGQGVLHSYYACPLISNGVEDVECWYCDYRIKSKDYAPYDYCFAKSGVQTYQDLLSITNVEKEDGKIVSISYNKNGEMIVKKFDKEVQLPGKTMFQLWGERTTDKLVCHNIYSDWYVLIEENPKLSYEKNEKVYGKLGRNLQTLEHCEMREIFGADSCYWETIK